MGEKQNKLLPFLSENEVEAGCDEAGRGCLAGPVVAAAVILPRDFTHPLLNDSKQLTEQQRNTLRPIIEQNAISWGIGVINNEKIDEINILNASFLSMHKAVDLLSERPSHLLIDGNKFNPYPDIPHTCVVKGDGKYLSIAAASILAKTFRDELMEMAAREYPGYGWETNKGYPTKAHRKSIKELGSSPLHRKSFKLLDDQMVLDL